MVYIGQTLKIFVETDLLSWIAFAHPCATPDYRFWQIDTSLLLGLASLAAWSEQLQTRCSIYYCKNSWGALHGIQFDSKGHTFSLTYHAISWHLYSHNVCTNNIDLFQYTLELIQFYCKWKKTGTKHQNREKF